MARLSSYILGLHHDALAPERMFQNGGPAGDGSRSGCAGAGANPGPRCLRRWRRRHRRRVGGGRFVVVLVVGFVDLGHVLSFRLVTPHP